MSAFQLKSSPFLNLVLEMHYEGRPIEAGTRIPKGSVIDLVVGDGGSKDVATPYVIGFTIEDAKVLLFGNNLNITVALVGDTLGVNPVILKQKPHPYENIRVGDVVELWVGKEGTPVPEEDEEEIIEEDGMEDEAELE
jgi:beta-lactam-binding protein with PASTA domain